MNPVFADLHAPATEATETLAGRRVERPRRSSTAQTPPLAMSSWWLWPHLLSLDAPLVALVWQRWWAHAAGVALPPSRELILGLGVWSIYLADRLADTAGGKGDGAGASRHRFSLRFRRLLLPLVGGLVVALTILTPCALPGVEFRTGLCLLALATGYFWLIHCWPGRGWAAYLPKEAVVGGMFSAGTIFFVACRSPRLPAVFWMSGGLFAAVCFLNCALITRWERHAQDLQERSSLLNSFPRLSSHLRGACVLLALAALAVAAATVSWVAVPVAFSAALLASLDRFAPRMSADALRILADAVLLTPLLGLTAWRQ